MTARVIVGDCRLVLPTLPLSAFDAIVTDPPYELGFMGKAWDRSGVAFNPMLWAHALRTVKPGAYLLAFGGTRTFHRLGCAIEDGGWELHDCLCWLYGSGFPKHNSKLKPAWEPIVMARSPMGAATALNIDACRINPGESVPGGGGLLGGASSRHEGYQRPSHVTAASTEAHNRGRWPANVVIDEDAADLIDEQSGTLTSGANPTRRGSPKTRNTYGTFEGQAECVAHRGVDVGGASRFYYCAKASRTERDAGLDGFDEQPLRWSNGDANPGSFQAEGTKKSARNNHPTVKPIALMRWLCRLVTPVGGSLLDPFAGSCSTGCACALEGFAFTGIESNDRYARIGEARMTHAVSRQSAARRGDG